MNRWLIGVAVALMAVGCAEGIEDPQPAPEPAQARKQVPAQTFSTEVVEEVPDSVFERVGGDLPSVPNYEVQPGPRW